MKGMEHVLINFIIEHKKIFNKSSAHHFELDGFSKDETDRKWRASCKRNESSSHVVTRSNK